MKPLTCKKCGWQWFPRLNKLPVVCPKCKSYSWSLDNSTKKSPDLVKKGGDKNEE